MTDETTDAVEEQSWDDWYRASEQIWSGNPNDALVQEIGDVPAGRALDLGAGEGADAIWLAARGWRVTAVDVSGVALERAAEHAREAGVVDRVEFREHDLAVSFPEGEWDLVSAQFLYSRGEFPREEILRCAAEAVAPGGLLLVEGHSGMPSWEQHEEDDRTGTGDAAGHDHGHHDFHLPTPQEVVDFLALPEPEWELLRCTEHPRTQRDPEGVPQQRTDNTVLFRRRER